MTIELLHPDDSGECADLGEGPTQDLRHYLNRRDTTDELTQNLGQYARPDVPFGYLRKTFDIDDTVVYRRDTVVYDQPPTVGIVRELAGPQKPVPVPAPPKPKYDDPAETGVNIFGGLGEHLPEVVFLEPHNYVGRHRHPEDLDAVAPGRHPAHERRLSPWWALAGVVLAGLAIWAGLILAGAAVFL